MNQYVTWLKLFKIAIGSAAAIMIAYALGLQYAVSAGIITLLTVQDTKKATFSTAYKRVIAFIITAVISFCVFSLFSYNPMAFGIYLFVFTGICFWSHMQEAIAMNAVLATHYLLEKSMTWQVMGNEACLLVVGAGIGILMNLYIPGNKKQIRQTQATIEGCLKEILSLMSKWITGETTITEIPELDRLKQDLHTGIEGAYTNMNNSIFQESRYFIKYMEMRQQQYRVLREIVEKINSLTMVTTQSREIGIFIQSIGSSLSESQNTANLLIEEKKLLEKFKEDPLPVSREEFENRAVLYNILMNLEIFLKIKKEFVDSLTAEQKKKYW